MLDCEYTNRKKMEEPTGKVFARLHHMKSFLCRTLKKTPKFCGGISARNGSYCSPESYYSMNNDDFEKFSDSTDATVLDITSDDTISSISGNSTDSGVSTLTDFSHRSSASSSSLHHRTATIPASCHLRCDPSIINYVPHRLLASLHSDYFLNDDYELVESSAADLPLAESSRRTVHDQTIVPDDDDEPVGPLTSTLVDRWYTITKSYAATFREDLSVRKTEMVQVLRCTHPHWIWVRNEDSQEGFIPTDCLTNDELNM